jgi:hypothetical protein
MKFRYFSEYGKVLPLPEVLNPNPKTYDFRDYSTECDYFHEDEYKRAVTIYADWLSKGIPVPDEHLKFFEVDRDESEFEKVWYNWGGFDKPDNYGWAALPIKESRTEPIKAFKNKITGSIAWRGDHPLATIYSDEYYLSKPDEWEPIKESKEQVDSPIEAKQSKMGLRSGDWYLNESGNKITVLSVMDGWCMVREGDRKPFVVPEEFVLGTFDKAITQ